MLRLKNNTFMIDAISCDIVIDFTSIIYIELDERRLEPEYFISEYFRNGWQTLERWFSVNDVRITKIHAFSFDRFQRIEDYVYLKDGQLHNLYGPAYFTIRPTNEFYCINGKRYEKEAFYKRKEVRVALRERKLKNVLK